ncbi:MAG TPA: SMC-Scp complex subunit ScpB [Thermomicrobiales bacterium]|nr:SMC-Scp complex subunit ScpB [Thermomicrobiales bacterium]
MSDSRAQPDAAEDRVVGDLTQLVIPGAEPGHRLSDAYIGAIIEAMLFVAPEPPTVSELAAGAELDPEEIERGLEVLRRGPTRGLVVQRHGETVTLGTAPALADHVRRFLRLDREARLSSAAMETLAIVAYRQPVTRSEIEAVRGVDCSGVIATLHARNLIESVSRRLTIGNPIQYGTTPEFLRHFGLSSLADLPSLGSINGEPGQDVLGAAMQEPPPPSDRQPDQVSPG